MLQDVAIETAFPCAGISRIEAYNLEVNETYMSALEVGIVYDDLWRNSEGVTSGSRAEGLALDDGWGHDPTDTDVMHIYGGPLGVNVPGGQRPRGKACLDFRPEGCPVGYTKLEITDLPGIREFHPSKSWTTSEETVHRSEDTYWLNAYQAVRGIQRGRGADISGPAAQEYVSNGRVLDIVATLVCNGSHPDLYKEFLDRPRQWPHVSLIMFLLKLPMLLVLVGHKLSPEFNLQARISWSHLELKLINEIPESVRQGYIACKYVLKRFLEAHRGPNDAGDGRSRVGSYHIKTVFLRYLEKTSPSSITSPFVLFLDLLRELDECLNVGKLSHYFLPQCNLLETVDGEERQIARQVILEIMSDPLNALLTSPTNPQQIYGEVRPDDLAVAFRRASAHLTSEQSRKDLSELLTRVDERRRERYRQQCQSDWSKYENRRVSGRPELIELVHMLKTNKT